MLSLSNKQWHIFYFSLAYLLAFLLYAIVRGNFEFIFYSAVVFFFLFLILLKQKTLQLSNGVLWGLSVWGLIHMMGGNIPVGDGVLYNVWIIPPNIFKYDQFVHAFGFGIATVVGWQLLRPYLTAHIPKARLAILLIMIGLGVGALNEIIEFVATVLVPDTNVGGYVNSMMDLVYDLLGAVIACIYCLRHTDDTD